MVDIHPDYGYGKIHLAIVGIILILAGYGLLNLIWLLLG